MASYNLFLLPGDGIGPEVMKEVEAIIGWFNAQGIAKFEVDRGLVGGSAYDAWATLKGLSGVDSDDFDRDGLADAVEAREGRQEARVEIDDATGKGLQERGFDDAHEPGQHDQRRVLWRFIAANQLHQRRIKFLTRPKGLVVQHFRGNAMFACQNQSFGICLVADDGGHARAVFFGPPITLRSIYDGGHVGPAARDQNNDVYHTGLNYDLHTIEQLQPTRCPAIVDSP